MLEKSGAVSKKAISLLLIALTGGGVSGPLAAQEESDPALVVAANDTHRSDENIARNEYRHPVETLTWFGLEPDMTVVEIWPGGGGWYTEVLAPYLREQGRLYAANYDGSSGVEYYRNNAAKYRDKLAAQPEVYDQVIVTELMPPVKLEAAPAESADMVLTFRNLHNWREAGIANQMFLAMFRALKPGGILGLVAHRARAGTDPSPKTGYVSEARAIQLAEAAGFEFLDRSEINANPKDTRKHPAGVWTLPPVFRMGDRNRAAYAAIGESDRMTLKFRKPRPAP